MNACLHCPIKTLNVKSANHIFVELNMFSLLVQHHSTAVFAMPYTVTLITHIYTHCSLCIIWQIYHHNTVGFDEFLGQLVYDKSDDTQPTMVSAALKPKDSSSRSESFVNCGQMAIEIATSHELDSI